MGFHLREAPDRCSRNTLLSAEATAPGSVPTPATRASMRFRLAE